MPDITMSCTDCHSQFTFTEGEQAFFSEKGFTPPVRCPDCRRRRKAEKMNNRSGFNDGGGSRGMGGGDRAPRSRSGW